MAWKQRTSSLPDAARLPGVYQRSGRAYPFCLPLEYATHNLLPEIREITLAMVVARTLPAVLVSTARSLCLPGFNFRSRTITVPLVTRLLAANDPAAIWSLLSSNTDDGRTLFAFVGGDPFFTEIKQGRIYSGTHSGFMGRRFPPTLMSAVREQCGTVL